MGDFTQLAQRRAIASQAFRKLRQALCHLRVARHDGLTQVIEVHLGSCIQQRRQQGNADGTAKVAQDVEQARRRACILRQDVAGGDQRDGHHDHRLAKGADDLDMVELFAGEVRIEYPGTEAGQAEQAETQGAENLG
ncbi:hypothetical protein D3C81_1278280 [compost metagenome]